MTTTHTSGSLALYLQYPMEDGQALLHLVDEDVVLELGALSDAADRDTRVADLVRTLRTAAVTLLVARAGSRPRPADLLLWTELYAALRHVRLLPLEVLPASD